MPSAYHLDSGGNKTLQEKDEVIYVDCRLCRSHQQTGFVDSVNICLFLSRQRPPCFVFVWSSNHFYSIREFFYFATSFLSLSYSFPQPSWGLSLLATTKAEVITSAFGLFNDIGTDILAHLEMVRPLFSLHKKRISFQFIQKSEPTIT